MNYNITETVGRRPAVVAIDDTQHLIAGAYFHNTYWRLFITESWTTVIGVPFKPDPLHMMTKDQAVHWVEMLAAAYCAASGAAA